MPLEGRVPGWPPKGLGGASRSTGKGSLWLGSRPHFCGMAARPAPLPLCRATCHPCAKLRLANSAHIGRRALPQREAEAGFSWWQGRPPQGHAPAHHQGQLGHQGCLGRGSLMTKPSPHAISSAKHKDPDKMVFWKLGNPPPRQLPDGPAINGPGRHKRNRRHDR
jgi:hypothetical protein